MQVGFPELSRDEATKQLADGLDVPLVEVVASALLWLVGVGVVVYGFTCDVRQRAWDEVMRRRMPGAFVIESFRAIDDSRRRGVVAVRGDNGAWTVPKDAPAAP